MEKKNLIALLTLMGLLVLCIALMGIALLVHERTFGQVSGYLAIACVAITLVGVAIIIRSDLHHKNK